MGASVPSLGLSNKAVYECDNAAQARRKSDKDPYPEESHFTAMKLCGKDILFVISWCTMCSKFISSVISVD